MSLILRIVFIAVAMICDQVLMIDGVQSSKLGDFYRIGKKYGTDKITHHGYHRFYPQYIEKYREFTEDYGMIEIGIQDSNSLRTWLEYFPRPFIYGIDIKLSKKGERYEIFPVDQSKKTLLDSFKPKVSHKIFFIIDDGSHIPEHQILTFNEFFKDLLLPGGTYIIEDIETSYWKRNGLYGYQTRYGINHQNSAIEVFKKVVDFVNNEFLSTQDYQSLMSSLNLKLSPETLELIQSISFGQNCVIFTKKTEEETELYKKRTYRFARNV